MGAVEGSGASGSGIRSTTILEAVATSAMMMGENALPGAREERERSKGVRGGGEKRGRAMKRG
eukprot:82268-Rhodomonas_salina.3